MTVTPSCAQKNISEGSSGKRLMRTHSCTNIMPFSVQKWCFRCRRLSIIYVKISRVTCCFVFELEFELIGGKMRSNFDSVCSAQSVRS